MGSWAQTNQYDQRTSVEGAEVVSAPGSQLALPGGTVLGEYSTMNLSQFSEFTPEVAHLMETWGINTNRTVQDVLGIAGQAVTGALDTNAALAAQLATTTAAVQTRADEAQNMAATATQSGSASLESLNKFIPVIVILGFLLAVFRK